MLFVSLEQIFLVTNKNSCQGYQIKRSSSCQSSSKMPFLIENLGIEILMMIGYGDRRRNQVEVTQLSREQHLDLPPMSQGTISKIEAQY
jgi:hypothetical protein